MYATPLLPAICELLCAGVDRLRVVLPPGTSPPPCRPPGGTRPRSLLPQQGPREPPGRCPTMRNGVHCRETWVTPRVRSPGAPRAPTPSREDTVVETPKQRTLAAELAAEFAGTLILILFGVGVVAQVVAGGIGDHDSIAWAWGLGVVLGVYVAARVKIGRAHV